MIKVEQLNNNDNGNDIETQQQDADNMEHVPVDSDESTGVVILRQPSVLTDFRHRTSFCFGITLVVCGTLSILFNVVNVCVVDQIRFRWVALVSGNGFWSGAAFIVTGGFGIASGKTRTRLTVTVQMILAILSSFMALHQFIIGVRASTHSESLCHNRRETDRQEPCDLKPVTMSLEACLATVAAVAAVTSVWSLIMTSTAVGCCNEQRINNSRQTTTTTMDTEQQRQTKITVLTNFQHRASRNLGITLVILGIITVILNSIDVIVFDEMGLFGFATGNGFWGGSVFIVAGSFGIASGRNRTRFTISVYMIVSIISSFLSFQQLTAGTLLLFQSRRLCHMFYFINTNYDHSCLLDDISFFVGILLGITGLAAFVLSIWSVVITVKIVACCTNMSVSNFNVQSTRRRDEQIVVDNNSGRCDTRHSSNSSNSQSSNQESPAAAVRFSRWDFRETANVLSDYQYNQSMFLGVSLIVIGALCLCCDVFEMTFSSWAHMLIGNSFVPASMFIVAGGIGIIASRNKTRVMIAMYLVMSILVTCFAFHLFGISIYRCARLSARRLLNLLWYQYLVLDGFLTALSILAGIASIWSIDITCRVLRDNSVLPATTTATTTTSSQEINNEADSEDYRPILLESQAPYSAYRHRHSLYLGITLIALGLLDLVFNVVLISFVDRVGLITFVIGNGFWGGLTLIVTGGVGIAASRSKTVLMISTFLGLVIFSLFLAVKQFIVGVRASVNISVLCDEQSEIKWSNEPDCHPNNVTMEMESCLACIAVASAVTLVYSLYITCTALVALNSQANSSVESAFYRRQQERQQERQEQQPTTSSHQSADEHFVTLQL